MRVGGGPSGWGVGVAVAGGSVSVGVGDSGGAVGCGVGDGKGVSLGSTIAVGGADVIVGATMVGCSTAGVMVGNKVAVGRPDVWVAAACVAAAVTAGRVTVGSCSAGSVAAACWLGVGVVGPKYRDLKYRLKPPKT